MKVYSGLEAAEAERTRLKRLRDKQPDWWASKSRSGWARRDFGETLVEETGEAWFELYVGLGSFKCSMCGSPFKFHEKFLHLEAQDEELENHFEEMKICKGCTYELETAVRELLG